MAQLRQGHKHTLTVAAGDLIGGSPFLSGLFHDEPSVESLNAMGLDVSSVGNHEFDEGVTELLRMQDGGCHPVDGCYFPDQPYAGADFPWLAANVVSQESGDTVLPPYWIEKFESVKVGFIGMTLEDTPTLVAQSGFRDGTSTTRPTTANALVPILKGQGVEAIVVLLHEGGAPVTTADINACVGISGPIVAIQDRLDAEIDAVITGHTHLPYNCVMTDPAGQPRLVTSAFSFGRVISEINLVLDKRTRTFAAIWLPRRTTSWIRRSRRIRRRPRSSTNGCRWHPRSGIGQWATSPQISAGSSPRAAPRTVVPSRISAT